METCPIFWGWGSRQGSSGMSSAPAGTQSISSPGPARCPPPQRDPGAARPEPPVWVPALGHRDHPVAPNATSLAPVCTDICVCQQLLAFNKSSCLLCLCHFLPSHLAPFDALGILQTF